MSLVRSCCCISFTGRPSYETDAYRGQNWNPRVCELEWTEVSLVQASHLAEEEDSGPDITQGTSSRAWPLGPSLLMLN